jgi:amidase
MGDASDDGGRPPQTPPLLDATIEQLQEGLVNGLFTSVDLVNVRGHKVAAWVLCRSPTKAYIARINEVNAQLHAVTEINPEALKIAAEKDYERRGKSPSGSVTFSSQMYFFDNYSIGLLHGIPVLLKNTIATYDQMNNTGEAPDQNLRSVQKADAVKPVAMLLSVPK